MVKAIRAAQGAAKKAIESTYCDTCTVVEVQKEKVKGVVKTQEVIVLEDQPCKLSFESIHTATKTEAATEITQEIKLFICPEIEIRSGSKIIVTHLGKTYEYARSGIPAVYETHQEILLEAYEEQS